MDDDANQAAGIAASLASMPVRPSCTILASAAVEPSRIPIVDGLAAAATVRGFGSQLGCAAFL
jgi:hypothetical protein